MVAFLLKLAFTLLGLGFAGFVGLMIAEESFNVYVKFYWRYALALVIAGMAILLMFALVALWMA